jgi:hypothetical protein
MQKQMEWTLVGLAANYETFREFMKKMMETFGDVNKKVTAQEQLLRSFQGKMLAEAFFQIFEQRVRAVRYEHDRNKYLIQLLKKGLNRVLWT